MRNPSRGATLPPLRFNALPEPDVIHRDETEEDFEAGWAEFKRLIGDQPKESKDETAI